ncbi:membrane protein [Mycobacterium sp. MFM001]|uniref:methanethiol S-methyltransferase n=1 Tax=Mycobacterium sp. MFM001 TaxID=2049453 RepID=UPI000DA5204C|nr:methanethiol S-methyltransferase [Mycobacterium sp. MFM001]GBE64817.1 membrane protein [Mycobacterium sp. MFM001]
MTQPTTTPRKVNRLFAVSYGALGYVAFVAAFLYAIGFVGDLWVPRSIDHAVAAPIGEAIVVNVLLLGIFAAQHSVMARPAFKRWWTRVVPQPLERSTYVILSSLALFLLYWQWRSMPTAVWDIRMPAARMVLWVLFWIGWATVFLSSFMISHLDLFGLRQVFSVWRGEPLRDISFRSPLLYRVVRHPLMVGFIIAFWAAPTMTAGHLLFSIATTAYILIAIQLEEHDLIAMLGSQYRDYRQRVPMLVPWPHRHA